MKHSLRIFHNPRCSKSRSACALLAERGITPEIIDYLQNPPSIDMLRELVGKLGIRPLDLVRQGEEVFKTEYAGKSLSDEEWLAALAAHPVLIERPLVLYGNQALIARPPEKLHAWLDALK